MSAPPLSRLMALSCQPPLSLLSPSSFSLLSYVLPVFIAERRWTPCQAGDLVILLQARGESCHGCHLSRQAQLALSPFGGGELFNQS